jgi:DNA damage-binding protein 1
LVSGSIAFQTSPASTFTYLTSQVVYVGSYLADSLLVMLHHTPRRNSDQLTLEIPPGTATVSAEKLTHPVTQEGVVIEAKGDYIEVLDEYPNLAPAEDAVLVDLTGGGQVCRMLLLFENETNSLSSVPGGRMFGRGLFW